MGKDAIAVGDNMLGGAPLIVGVGVPDSGEKEPASDWSQANINSWISSKDVKQVHIFAILLFIYLFF